MNLFADYILLLAICVASVSSRRFQDAPVEEETTTPGNEDENGSDEDGQPSSDVDLVAFYLYPNPENNSYLEEIRFGDPDSLMESSYSPSKKLVILIHGFVNNYTCKFSQRVKNAYLEAGLGDIYNIIVVDWGALSTPRNQTNLQLTPLNDAARNPFYQKAVQNVPRVGRRVAEFVQFLINENYLDSTDNVHLIGFSLGAQVSGCAGYETRQNSSALIGRVSGLDPAGPLFQTQPNKALKLDASDATFVDVIHTNQGQSGYEGDIGHADFYPNGGGPNQNDCINLGVDAVQSNAAGICAHNRCWVYYIKSIFQQVTACKCVGPPNFLCQTTCSAKELFGYPTPPTARGTFYVDINAKDQECSTQNCVQEDDYEE